MAKRSKKKQRRIAKVEVARKPREASTGRTVATSTRSETPQFFWNAALWPGDFGFDHCPNWKLVVETLESLQSMTFGEILGSNHHEYSALEVSSKAQQVLRTCSLLGGGSDLDEVTLLSLRLTGAFRVICIRDSMNKARCNIVLCDPNHEVYPSKKKGT